MRGLHAISFYQMHGWIQWARTFHLTQTLGFFTGPSEYWGGYVEQHRRQWHPTPVLLHGKSHGRRSLVGCSPWGCKESNTTERLHFHFLLSCIGEGNGNPLQCSCLVNPKDGRVKWLRNWSDLAAVAAAILITACASSSLVFHMMYCLHRGIPNNVCRSSALKEVEFNWLPRNVSYEWWLPELEHRKGETMKKFTIKKLTNTT